jgi:hypothetical protein
MNIVDGSQGCAQNISHFKQMVEIGSGEGGASGTITVVIDRVHIVSKPSICHPDPAAGGVHDTRTGVTGLDHTVEHVNATGNAFYQVQWTSNTH